MLTIIAILSLLGGLTMLIALSIVDLRTRLLPNEMVLGFATLGFIFHLTTLSAYVSPTNIALGGAIGFLSLYLIRAAANRIYGEDALGLGDVKLMGAGGVWLGPDMIMIAMSVGAALSLIHGFFVAMRDAQKNKTKPDFANLKIPAGPGFAAGITIAGAMAFKDIFSFFSGE